MNEEGSDLIVKKQLKVTCIRDNYWMNTEEKERIKGGRMDGGGRS